MNKPRNELPTPEDLVYFPIYCQFSYIYIYIYIWEKVDFSESVMIKKSGKWINQTLTTGLVVIFGSLFKYLCNISMKPVVSA